MSCGDDEHVPCRASLLHASVGPPGVCHTRHVAGPMRHKRAAPQHPTTVGMNALDALNQRAVGSRLAAFTALPPGIVPTLTHLQNLAHDLDLKLRSVPLDERKS